MLSSIPLHVLSILNPAKIVTDQNEKVFAHFLWGELKAKLIKAGLSGVGLQNPG